MRGHKKCFIPARYFPIFLYKNISCDPSLEPSCTDGSNEGSQDMFLFLLDGSNKG